MKTAQLLMPLLVFASGCVHPGIKPHTGIVKSNRPIVILPVEPPPLAVPPGVANTLRGIESLSWVESPASDIGHGSPGVLALVSGILILAATPEPVRFFWLDLPAETRQAAKVSRSLEEMLSREKVWCPTVVLAQTASELLAASSEREVFVLTNYVTLGVKNRKMTWHIENWYLPIARWYNQTTSPFTNAAPEIGRDDYVLEVGLCNYELTGESLLVQVMVRLVDPANGRVVGRARRFALPSSGPMATLFIEDGKRYKELFARTGKDLLAKAMKDLSLLPK